MLCALSQSTAQDTHSYWQSRGSCMTLVNSICKSLSCKTGFSARTEVICCNMHALSGQIEQNILSPVTNSMVVPDPTKVLWQCWDLQPLLCAKLKIAPPEVHALSFTPTPAVLSRPVEVQIFLAVCHEWRNVFSKVTSLLRAALPRQTGPKCDYSNCSQGRELTPQ